MHHHLPRVAGLVALLAAFVLTPGAYAAKPAKMTGATPAKERAHGKHCGAKSKKPARAAARAKCLTAMDKLARGASTSPSKACAGLSKKKVAGERKSAFARCVGEGAKLLKAKKRAERDGDEKFEDELAADDGTVDDAAADDAFDDKPGDDADFADDAETPEDDDIEPAATDSGGGADDV